MGKERFISDLISQGDRSTSISIHIDDLLIGSNVLGLGEAPGSDATTPAPVVADGLGEAPGRDATAVAPVAADGDVEICVWRSSHAVVVGDEVQLKFAKERLTKSGLAAQIGLVIGKLSSRLDRGFIFDLVLTPLNDACEPAFSIISGAKDDRKKGSKGKMQTDSSALFVDQDWVAEHARKVGRMLLGGVKVVGIYILASENAFKNSTITICQTIQVVANRPLLWMLIAMRGCLLTFVTVP